MRDSGKQEEKRNITAVTMIQETMKWGPLLSNIYDLLAINQI